MSFSRLNDTLHAEAFALDAVADAYGTPCYVYSRAMLEAAFMEYSTALRGQDALVCYAVKANSNLAILNLFAKLGAGFDIVSLGELERALSAGADPQKIVFSGVGKRENEIVAALEAGIACFNVESEPELYRIDRIARTHNKRAPISLRVNPDVDAKTHPYISTGLKENKFGVAWDDALRLYRLAASLDGLHVVGIDCHIGSQLLEIAPFIEALDKLLDLVDALSAEGIHIHHLDLGGGLGICYRDEKPPTVSEYLQPILARLHGRNLKLLLEPGRRLVGNAGLLLTRIEYLKQGGDRKFAIVDAAMNDLMRPALYEAWHDVKAVRERSEIPAERYEIVGPICESGDFLGRDRELAVREGDYLAIMSAGAYGMTMSSNYNSRPRAAEIMVDGARAHLIRHRETTQSLYADEKMLPD